MVIYLALKTQIALLVAEKVTILTKYAYFANIFSKKLVKVLSKQTSFNEHTIKLVDSKQPHYRRIYSLGLVKLKRLKTYIDNNLTHDFIQLFKSPVDSLILFVYKLNTSFCL